MEVEECEVEEVVAEDAAGESRLARKVASFGMAAGRYYTPRRMNSEEFKATRSSPIDQIYSHGVGPVHTEFIF